MNRERKILLNVVILAVALGIVGVAGADEMGTAFTYQGRLTDANSPAEGLYDFQFEIYDALDGGSQQGSTVDVNDLDVTDSYFTVELDFGSSVFIGDARWLQIAVRPGESSDPDDFATLSPRQELTPTPHAIYAENAGSDNDWAVSGDDMYSTPYGNVGIGTTTPAHKLEVKAPTNQALRLSTESTNSHVDIQGTPTGSGSLRLNVNGGANAITFNINNNEKVRMASSGNVGIGTTTPASKLDVSGTVNAAAFVGDGSGLTNLPSTADSDWTISSDDMYSAVSGNVGIGTTTPAAKLTVNGGILRDGSTMYGANADTHINLGVSSTTGITGLDYSYATVGGGYFNEAGDQYATVGGGKDNTASDEYATIAGCSGNTAGKSSTVSGGVYNTASGMDATVSGGAYNTASGLSATVPGGYDNNAAGKWSFAAGRRAKANHDGTFVWADTTDIDFTSTGPDQFLIRASGNVGINTTSPEAPLHIAGGNWDLTNTEGDFKIGDSAYRLKIGIATGGGGAGTAGIRSHGGAGNLILGSNTTEVLIVQDTGGGRVGIGTMSPNGTLDVNGSIYQRGGVLHADYVFESDYNLESIEEHAEFMWTNKHLPAIPGAKTDETGHEIVEVGAHRKGIVEELEKAHIYIDCLHNRIRELEKKDAKIVTLSARLADIEKAISKLANQQVSEY